jgi:hypothetical protein
MLQLALDSNRQSLMNSEAQASDSPSVSRTRCYEFSHYVIPISASLCTTLLAGCGVAYGFGLFGEAVVSDFKMNTDHLYPLAKGLACGLAATLSASVVATAAKTAYKGCSTIGKGARTMCSTALNTLKDSMTKIGKPEGIIVNTIAMAIAPISLPFWPLCLS